VPGGSRSKEKKTMNVRAKFRCNFVAPTHTNDPNATCVRVDMMPVYADGKGNDSWSKATPGGQLTMWITNPAAADAFEPGKEYFLDFTPAE
jgi:hypothetical protein